MFSVTEFFHNSMIADIVYDFNRKDLLFRPGLGDKVLYCTFIVLDGQQLRFYNRFSS